jgi:hypothetical protein
LSFLREGVLCRAIGRLTSSFAHPLLWGDVGTPWKKLASKANVGGQSWSN